MVNSKYLDLFLDESQENLQTMNNCMLAIERGDDIEANIKNIFRAAHTIKGSSSTMGFSKIASVTHHLESLLALIREGALQINEDIVSIAFEALDAIDNLMYGIGQTQKEGDLSIKGITTKLDSIIDEYSAEKATHSTNASKSSSADYRVIVQIDPDCSLKMARALVVITKLKEHGVVVGIDPKCLEKSETQGEFNSDVFVVEYNTTSIDDIRDILFNISEVRGVKIDKNKKKQIAQKNGNVFRSGSTLKVDINKLDGLMNLVSEMVVNRTRLTLISKQIQNQGLAEVADSINRNILGVQDLVMNIRMVPIETIFNRFPRMVRDLAKQLDKDIRLTMHGQETELDRTIIDEIGEPLLHMVRNAVDHGIEKPEGRLKNDKTEQGTLTLAAYQRGDSVIIEVADDGAGIDPDVIKEKAISQGIITRQQSEQLSDYDILQFIFEPGFSTAEQVSDVSGRGVGMDVVKSKFEELGGKVDIKSEFGSGTTFTVTLPLTLAIVSSLLIDVNEQVYALPLGLIDQTLKIDQEEIYIVEDQEVIKYRDSVIPIFSLASLLNQDQVQAERFYVIVLKVRDKKVGLIIDKILGQEEIVVKPLGKFVNKVKDISGAAILGDGGIVLIIDTSSLF